MQLNDKYEEWYFQSDYDLETAEDMLTTGRNVYCIFMCHLSLEKALKGLYIKRTGQFPAKTHNLVYFTDKLNIIFSEAQLDFISVLNSVSIPTRYPEDIRKLFSVYLKERAQSILSQTKEIQLWIRQQ